MNENLNDDLINFDDFPQLGNSEEEDNIFNEEKIIKENEENELEESILNNNDENKNNIDSDLLTNLLLQKGITDSSKISIENENGEIEEINFNDLSLEEQLDILEYDNSPQLDDSEIDTINYLRENNVSLEQLIEYQRNLAIQEYLQGNVQSTTVDSLSDEELYKLDIKQKFNSLSEEEIDQELQKELNNPDLFKKKIDQLRELYKKEEEEENIRLQQEEQQQLDQEYENTVNLMVETAQNTNELFDLELEDEDKEEVLQFLLQKDINNQTEFVKMLNDPQKLFELAWFAKKGKEAFDTIHEYYRKEIDSARKNNGSSSLTSSRRTVVKKENTTKQGDDPYELNNYLK